MSSPLWQLEDSLAQLKLPRFAAAVDPLRPGRGLLLPQVDGLPLEGLRALEVLLADVAPEQAGAQLEYYIRVNDLVASYAERPEAEMRAQVYWRAQTYQVPSMIASVEVLASVQTSLLDSCPQISLRSEIIASQAFGLLDPDRGTFVSIVPEADRTQIQDPGGLNCYLFRLPGGLCSYVEMVHPAEAQNTEWDGWLHGADYRMQLRHQLFLESLEKGVILRARVLGALVDRQHDHQTATALYREFLAAKLPLTT